MQTVELRHNNNAHPLPTRKLVSLLSVMAGVLIPTAAPKADQNHIANPGIVPINAHFGGVSYGDWIAKSYQWSLSLPAADNPIFPGNESNIAARQSGPVWFLAELLISPIIELHYT